MKNDNGGEIVTKDELLAGKWTPVRNEVWLSTVLSQGAKLCYIAICSHIWRSQCREAWPGQKRLAEMLNVSVRSVKTYLKELRDVGIIKVARQGLTKPNLYYICKPNIDALKPVVITEVQMAAPQEGQMAALQEGQPVAYKEEEVNNKKESSSDDDIASAPTQKTDDDFVGQKNLQDNPKHPEKPLPTPLKRIEDKMIVATTRKNGLAGADSGLAFKMLKDGIPVETILQGIDITVSNSKDPVGSLKYCENEILKLHAEQRRTAEDQIAETLRRLNNGSP